MLTILLDFQAPGSGSAFPIRIRIRDSQINADPDTGSTTLIRKINCITLMHNQKTPVVLLIVFFIFSAFSFHSYYASSQLGSMLYLSRLGKLVKLKICISGMLFYRNTVYSLKRMKRSSAWQTPKPAIFADELKCRLLRL